jgi:hypothetical protein
MGEGWSPDEAFDAADARLAVRVGELEQMPLGAGLLAGLIAVTPVPMSGSTAVRVTELWDRFICFAQAQSMISCAEAVRSGDLPGFLSGLDAAQLIGEELAARTHVSFSSAMNRLGLVAQVGRQLPLGWEALNRGELSLTHLKALAAQTGCCPPRVAQAVDARVVPEAITLGWTPYELGNAAARVVLAIDPDGAAERAAQSKKDADVVLYPRPDETAAVVATGDAVTMRRVMDTIDSRAAEMGRAGDPRPVGPRRLAALAEYVLGQQQGGNRPVVQAVVTVDLPTLLGLTERPGELSGYGPISAATARDLAADASLRRLVTDPLTGIMIDLGHRSYAPSALLRRIVEATHRTCRFPGCARRAIQCDCDHIRNHHDGGPTATSNLHPLCRRHHNLKTLKLWTVDVHPDGSETWTSALGFSYRKPPATYPTELLDPPPFDLLEDPDPYQLREADPDPPTETVPLPEPPPITDTEYEAFTDAIEQRCYATANLNYDQWRNLGLVS